MAEAEVTRVRTLRGFWRNALIVATAATIFLCINQQFALRFFIGYTQLNTEYFYLLIALLLPFTFLIFPASENAALDRAPWYDIALAVITFAASLVLMSYVRRAAEAGWEFGGAPTGAFIAGLVMWAVLMEALRRTGGWSLLLCILPFTLYPLFADSAWLGPMRGTQSTLEQATAYHMRRSLALPSTASTSPKPDAITTATLTPRAAQSSTAPMALSPATATITISGASGKSFRLG